MPDSPLSAPTNNSPQFKDLKQDWHLVHKPKKHTKSKMFSEDLLSHEVPLKLEAPTLTILKGRDPEEISLGSEAPYIPAALDSSDELAVDQSTGEDSGPDTQ